MAASFGLVMDPWQAFVLEQSLGERPDGKWAAFEVGVLCPRQNGKGSILEARELAGLFLFGEKKITHSAHELKTSKDHFNRMESLLRGAGYGDDLIHYRRSNEEVSITVRKTGHKMLFLTRTTGGGRGLGGDLVVMDEAYALTDDMMAALMPTMAARSMTGNPQLWFTSSAGFEYSDVLSKVRADGEGNAPRLAYFDWSCDPDADPDDPEEWANANPGLGVRISEEFVASERRRMGDEEFRRERLGIWADDGSGLVISAADWGLLADRESKRVGSDVVFGVAAEQDRSSAAILVACNSPSGRVHVEVIDPGRELSIPEAGERLVGMVSKYRTHQVLLSSTDGSASLVPQLKSAGVPLTVVGPQQLRAAAGAFVDGVKGRQVVHTGLQLELSRSVELGRKQYTAGSWVWADNAGSAALRAATLAFYGWPMQKPTRKSRIYAF